MHVLRHHEQRDALLPRRRREPQRARLDARVEPRERLVEDQHVHLCAPSARVEAEFHAAPTGPARRRQGSAQGVGAGGKTGASARSRNTSCRWPPDSVPHVRLTSRAYLRAR